VKPGEILWSEEMRRAVKWCDLHKHAYIPEEGCPACREWSSSLVDRIQKMSRQEEVEEIELTALPSKPPALKVQVGGDHYKKLKIQPVEYNHANNLPFIEGCIVKYVTRHRDKGGAADIRKVIHFAELLLQLEYPDAEA
jgi:hypothetical protein